MNLPTPKLDDRGFDDLIAEARQRIAARCPEWTDFNYSDPGIVLVELMAWMTETALYRLNRVPELNYIKFLELIGVRLQPAKPARTWVFFQTGQKVEEDDAKENYLTVPAGTRVSTRPESGQEPIPFVTRRHLVLTTRTISKTGSRYPVPGSAQQRQVVHDLCGVKPRAANIFDGGTTVRHHFYLGDTALCEFGARDLRIVLQMEKASKGSLFLEWEIWDGDGWRIVMPDEDTTRGFAADGGVLFRDLPAMKACDVAKLTAPLQVPPPPDPQDKDAEVFWIRARLIGSRSDELPVLRSVRRQIGLRECSVPPQKAWVGTPTPVAPSGKYAPPAGPFLQPLEFNQEFEPLGPKPVPGSAFYLQSELFQRRGATIRIELHFRPGTHLRPVSADALKIHWEYRAQDRTWRSLGECNADNVVSTDHDLRDGTRAFTKDGRIEFTCPADIDYTQLLVNSEQKGWFIRARVEHAELPSERQVPLVATRIALGFTEIPTSQNPSRSEGNLWKYCFTENYFQLKRYSASQSFSPFEIDSSKDPAFYLCFNDRPSTKRSGYQLFLDVVPQKIDSDKTGVVWDYDAPQSEPALFSVSDFQDPPGLIAKLVHQSDSVSRDLWKRLPEATQKMLRAEGFTIQEKISALADALNRILQSGSIYGPSPFEGVKLSQNTRLLKSQHPEGKELIRLNRFLLVDAYPLEIAPAPTWRWRPIEPLVEPKDARMIWEYSTGPANWKRLEVKDGTDAFSHPGMLEFNAPGDWKGGDEFGKAGHWLRVRWEAGEFLKPIRLQCVKLNGVEVEQSLQQERILGISSGAKNQSFSLHTEILDSPQVWVGVTDTNAETIRIEAREPDSKLTMEQQGDRLWVKWEEVRNFHGSKIRDQKHPVRHFIVDLSSGTFSFGDDLNGSIPPQGAKTQGAKTQETKIKAIYRINAGSAGNVGVNTITVLDSPPTGVQGVYNIHPAEGGSDRESIENAKTRGPWEIRHRDRAVTEEDFQELAKKASPVVRFAKCFSEGGVIHVVIVPEGECEKPQPSRRLVEDVFSYLSTKTLINTRLEVHGPEYEPVDLEIEVVLNRAFQHRVDEIKAEIEGKLRNFVHPITGMSKKSGWEIGRTLHLSELYYCLEGIDGVDHVEKLQMRRSGSRQFGETRIAIKERSFPCFSKHINIQHSFG